VSRIGIGGYQRKHGVCKRRERIGGLLNLDFAICVAAHSLPSICPSTLDQQYSKTTQTKPNVWRGIKEAVRAI
jgi:hypothetical protein